MLRTEPRCGGAVDILIAACARNYQVELEHADSDFTHLEQLA